MGFEPTASTMRMWRAPSCANAPYFTLYHRFSEKESKNFQCLKYKVIAGRSQLRFEKSRFSFPGLVRLPGNLFQLAYNAVDAMSAVL